MISPIRYSAQHRDLWDSFVKESKNGTFLLMRDYMDYHSDRFTDRSYLFMDNKGPVALLPACESNDRQQLISHGGLTYGGLIMSSKTTTAQLDEALEALCVTLKTDGIKEVIYKPTPHIYHHIPSEEDLYLLVSRYNATLIRRDISSVVDLTNPITIRRIRRCGQQKAAKSGLNTQFSSDYSKFWDILNHTLKSRHNVSPVHTKAELQLLASRFPDNIKLIATYRNTEMIAGTVLFITDTCIHSQYIATTDEGRALGALDQLFIDILTGKFPELSGHRYFDFGRSTEGDGTQYNADLLYQKEGFGARAVCYDTYSLIFSKL